MKQQQQQLQQLRGPLLTKSGFANFEYCPRAFTCWSHLLFSCMSLSQADIANLALTCGVADASLLNDANFSNRNLVNVSQISVLTSLRSLNLSFNKIVKITPLIPLHSLSVLNLMHNEIADLQPLASITSLTILRLSHNKFKELSPLSSLCALEELWIQAIPSMSLAHVFATLKPLPVLHRCTN